MDCGGVPRVGARGGVRDQIGEKGETLAQAWLRWTGPYGAHAGSADDLKLTTSGHSSIAKDQCFD